MTAVLETPKPATPASSDNSSSRFHAGLNVADLERSVRFYQLLFNAAPAKHYADYAKFEVDEPPLTLALYPSPQAAGGALNHMGLRYPDSAALVDVQRRLEEAGIPTQRQEGVECCYALQTKFWVTDPDRNLWELYTLHEDIEHSGFDDAPPPMEPAATAAWDHRLTDPIPERIPHDDGALDEVRLEGAFNGSFTDDQLMGLLRESVRALRPGGKIAVHGLVSDRPFPGEPKLPGMAALVRRVPVFGDVAAMPRESGFVDHFFEKLGDIHCFSVNGVELRELRLVARKPGAKIADECDVVYKGPLAEVVDERGITFRRGERVRIAKSIADALRTGPAAAQFAFLV